MYSFKELLCSLNIGAGQYLLGPECHWIFMNVSVTAVRLGLPENPNCSHTQTYIDMEIENVGFKFSQCLYFKKTS